MTSPRAHNSPMRERLLSQSPDAMKNSILRESGMGWNSPPRGPRDDPGRSIATSPLRISKSDNTPLRRAPPELARRTSSSYKHVRNNNLVSKSPFKSQLPTSASNNTPKRMPATISMSPSRRVSGEKRQRPLSMQEQAETENDRPFALKRERRQSKTFQGLIEREPVSKSPFRRLPNKNNIEAPPIPVDHVVSKPIIAVPPTPSRIPVMPGGGSSPTRSALSTKRLHGPRMSGSIRPRRKTVTFDERCDVMEISDAEEVSEETIFLDSDEDAEDAEFDHPGDPDPFFQGEAHSREAHDEMPDGSYDSIDISENAGEPLLLDPDTSISGIVEQMFAASQMHSTPPRHNDIPTDLETEDGVPFGRTHHYERAMEHHRHEKEYTDAERDISFPLNVHSLPSSNNVTPPKKPSPRTSTPPLGRSTHLERQRANRMEEEEEERDVEMLPESPSPIKHRPRQDRLSSDGLIPRFNLSEDFSHDNSNISDSDPFLAPQLRDEPLPDHSVDDFSSIGEISTLEKQSEGPSQHAESMTLKEEEIFEQTLEDAKGIETSFRTSSPALVSTPPLSTVSPISRSPAGTRPQRLSGSPISRSPALVLSRISRENIKQRLLRRRSATPEGSPGPSANVSYATPPRIESPALKFPDEEEKDKDTVSVMTGITDISTETATVQIAEKKFLDDEFGLLMPSSEGSRLKFDFGSKFGRGGLDIQGFDMEAVSSEPLPPRPPAIEMGSGGRRSLRMEVGPMDVDMDMRSALDKLMDDVGGNIPAPDVSLPTTEEDDSMYVEAPEPPMVPHVVDSASDSDHTSNNLPADINRNSSLDSIPPPPPPKDNIKSREALILEKRREARRIEEEAEDDFLGRPRRPTMAPQVRASRRRSMSTGDLLDVAARSRPDANPLLDLTPEKDDLSESISKELNKFVEPSKKKKYMVREHAETIYASSDMGRISHMAGPGDVNAGRAWKTVRRPSDMNEYAKQIRDFRSQEKPGKAYGKVFVKVLGVTGLHIPMPKERTAITCTLNNGIHFVTTPESQLASECRIEQEFELIEHSKLELTLTLKIRRDPHIIAQFKSLAPPPPPAPAQAPPPLVQQHSKTGMRSFFSSSPKKSKEKLPRQVVPTPTPARPLTRLPECLARYLKADGTLARAFIAFKDIAHRCDTRLFETTYPLIGQRIELGNKFSTLQVGEIRLQVFRLPPLPGVPTDQLPQSLEECHRGLRHINWHKVTYFEGTLTQNGGDCSSWRRRQLRVIGANLVAFNDVTKRATATINLKKAIAIEDDQEARHNTMSPASQTTTRSNRYVDEYDGLYGVERSFRLIFPDDEIVFFADTDEEKAKWLDVLRALVGHIPPHPLWAELLWQRQEELTKQSHPMSR